MPDRIKIQMLTGGFIDWQQPSAVLEAFVRVMGLEIPARATIDGLTLALHRVRVGGTVSVYPPGTITRLDDQVWVQTGRGHLAIDRIAVRGIEMNAAAYLASRELKAGDAFDAGHTWTIDNTLRELSHAA